MFTQRPFRNRLVLLSLILVQLCLITSYFIFYKSDSRKKLNKIAFLPKVYASDKTNQKTFCTLKDIIEFKKISSKKLFLDFNTSMCFSEGTDIKAMSVIKGINWKCNCLPGKYILIYSTLFQVPIYMQVPEEPLTSRAIDCNIIKCVLFYSYSVFFSARVLFRLVLNFR